MNDNHVSDPRPEGHLETFELCPHFAPRSETENSRRCSDCQNDIDEVYEEFWFDLVTTDGLFDKEKVKAELFDYHFLLEEIPRVYDSLTGGRLSKPNYPADIVISTVEDLQTEEITGAVQEAIDDLFEELSALRETSATSSEFGRRVARWIDEKTKNEGEKNEK